MMNSSREKEHLINEYRNRFVVNHIVEPHACYISHCTVSSGLFPACIFISEN